MSRESQQISSLIEALVRNLRGRVSGVWLVVAVVLLGCYLVAEPALESRFGVDLPGVSTPGEVIERADESSRDPSTPTASTTTKQNSEGESLEDIKQLLKHVGNDVFVSPAGLRYTKGSVHGHRLKHLMAHTRDEPDRPGSHGVFDSTSAADVIRLVDAAYRQSLAGNNVRKAVEQDRTVYEVDMGRQIGYVGGESGKRQGHPAARYLELVIEHDAAGPRFITAYPIRSW